MRSINIPTSSVRVNTTTYSQFRGVDLSTDSTQIKEYRSPYAPNLVSDSGGFPEKRVGWRSLINLGMQINGIYRGVIGGTEYILVHSGFKIYLWDEETNSATDLGGSYKNGKGTSFCLGDKLYILTGAEYLCFDGSTLQSVEDIAYVPTTTISRLPADIDSGVMYENANLLSKKRKNSFIGDGETKIYHLDVASCDNVTPTVTIDGSVVTTGWTFTRSTGVVTFTTAPPAPQVDGQDNVVIEFSKTISGYANRVKKCTIATLYGVGSNDRAFISGNPDYPATDWWSWFKDPTYFPDQNYADVGTQETAIMGYSHIGAYLAIHKEENAQDATIYLRSASLISESTPTAIEKVAFPTTQGVAGIGAIAKGGFANLIGEPLFLARTGVYALTTTSITAERTVQNRSYYVDAKLTAEPNLQDAVAAQWNGYYLLAINGNCYVLDGKQNKAYQAQSNGNYVYECYYWTNIPARQFLEREGDLFFGTKEGWLCRFNNDIKTMARFNDNGYAIPACWATKADDDGDFMTKKTMQKRGSGVMIKPYTRSSAQISVKTEKDERDIRSAQMDILDWEDINFERFTFNTSDSPQVVPFNARVKKYITLQIFVKNEEFNEGFGVFGIIKRFSRGNYVKR